MPQLAGQGGVRERHRSTARACALGPGGGQLASGGPPRESGLVLLSEDEYAMGRAARISRRPRAGRSPGVRLDRHGRAALGKGISPENAKWPIASL